MKSFKEYLYENSGMKWDYSGFDSKNHHLGRKAGNRTRAEELLSGALENVNSPYGKALNVVKDHLSKGTIIPLGDPAINDVLQSIHALTYENKKRYTDLLGKIGVNADEAPLKKNPAAVMGEKISFENSKKEIADNGPKVLDKKIPAIKAEEPSEEEPEEDPSEETPEKEPKEEEPKKVAEEPSEKEELKKEEPKKVDDSNDNSKDPADMAKKAQSKIDAALADLESRKKDLPTDKAAIIDKAILDFKKKANAELNGIRKQQDGFSIHANPASKLKASINANKFYNNILYLTSKASLDANKIYKLNVGEKLEKGVNELGQGIKRTVGKVTGTKTFQDTKDLMTRAIKKAAPVVGKAAKDTVDAAGRVITIAKESKTAQALKDKVKEVDQKIADKISAKKVPAPALAPTQAQAEPESKQKEFDFSGEPAKQIRDKIQSQTDQATSNVPKVDSTTTAVMDKATKNKILPQKRVMGKARTKEEDEEGNIVKTKII